MTLNEDCVGLLQLNTAKQLLKFVSWIIPLLLIHLNKRKLIGVYDVCFIWAWLKVRKYIQHFIVY